MPSRIHAICNPVLLFHVAIHSCAPLDHQPPRHPSSIPPLSSPPPPPPLPHSISADTKHRPTNADRIEPTDRPTNGRPWPLPSIAARCTLCPIHDSFFIAIKMQLRRFDKARITGGACTIVVAPSSDDLNTATRYWVGWSGATVGTIGGLLFAEKLPPFGETRGCNEGNLSVANGSQ